VFTSDEVRAGPSVDALAEIGGNAAVELVQRYYGVHLLGPSSLPPGPGPLNLPPWWEKNADPKTVEAVLAEYGVPAPGTGLES
jgi:hypothetical protein